MAWEYSVGGGTKQKLYGNYLVRYMAGKNQYWVLDLSFLGMIVLETSNIRQAIKFAKQFRNLLTDNSKLI